VSSPSWVRGGAAPWAGGAPPPCSRWTHVGSSSSLWNHQRRCPRMEQVRELLRNGSWAGCWPCVLGQAQAWVRRLIWRRRACVSLDSALAGPCCGPRSAAACQHACSSRWTPRTQSIPWVFSPSSGNLAVAWVEEQVEHRRLPPRSVDTEVLFLGTSSSSTPHNLPSPRRGHSYAPLAGGEGEPPYFLFRSNCDPS